MQRSFAFDSTGGVRVELSGQFNPMILQPAWLRANGLIDEEDYAFVLKEDRHYFIVSADFTGVQMRWASIEVTRESFELSSKSGTDTPNRILQLALGLFELLPHTPVQTAFIQHSRHFSLPVEHWEQIADRAAPSAVFEEGLGASRLQSLERLVSTDAGELSFLLEPSGLDGYTTYISITDRVEFENPDESNARAAAEWLSARWEESREGAESLMEKVIKQ